MILNIDNVIQQAEDHCRNNGGRLTKKRRLILEILLENGQPQSAYEIADLYHEKAGDSIPAMSVYRMLDFLMQNGLAHKLTTTNKFLACSHINCDHTHQAPQFLICDSCNAVNEIGLDKTLISALEKSINAIQFQLNSPQLELHGLCEGCQK